MKSKIFLIFLTMLFSIFLISATTIITDNEIDTPKGIFEIIDMKDIPLIFEDSINNRIVAIFNGNRTFNDMITQNQSFMMDEGTITFVGDVDNVDNVNDFSRFSETNLNNGTSASSGFTANNDIGFNISFGITSSGFKFSGVDLPNIGVILSKTPSPFYFVNDFSQGWFWISDRDNTSIITQPNTAAYLSREGSFNISGNFTGNQFYGDMFLFKINNPEIIVIDKVAIINDSGIFNAFNITGYEPAELNGFIFENDSLVAQVPGLYRASFSISYEGIANERHGFGLVKNGELNKEVVAGGFINVAGDIRSISSQGLIRLDVGDRVKLVVGDRFSPPKSITVLVSNVNLVRVGH